MTKYDALISNADFCKSTIISATVDVKEKIQKLINAYDFLQQFEEILKDFNKQILESDIRFEVEHPEECICKNCKYFHRFKKFENREWTEDSCCIYHALIESDAYDAPVIFATENDKCEVFKRRKPNETAEI